MGYCKIQEGGLDGLWLDPAVAPYVHKLKKQLNRICSP